VEGRAAKERAGRWSEEGKKNGKEGEEDVDSRPERSSLFSNVGVVVGSWCSSLRAISVVSTWKGDSLEADVVVKAKLWEYWAVREKDTSGWGCDDKGGAW
jgi:hypothetical protein